ncbi:MAG TPA: AI-2E family transporter [Chloroflexota bacterium]|nr:AI-2E family transporter [Chloroflexota bacterium]
MLRPVTTPDADSAGAPDLTRFLVVLASLVIILAGLKAAADILSPVLLALLIVMVISPVRRWLVGRGASPGLAGGLLGLAVVLVTLAVLWFVAGSVAQLAVALPTYREEAGAQVAAVQAGLAARGVDAGPGADVVQQSLDSALSVVLSFIGGLVGAVASVGWMLYLFLFMLVDARGFPARLRRGLGAERPVVERLTRYARALSDFISIKAGLGLLAATGDVVLLSVLGVDFALLWGVLSFLMSFIPSIGYLIALIPPVLVALLQHGPGTALIVLVGYQLINGLVDSVLGPRLLGRGLDVAAIVTILSLVLWGFILGPVGALLSVPLTVLVKMVVLDHYPASRWLSVTLGDGDGDGDGDGSAAPAAPAGVPQATAPAGPNASVAG